MGKAQKQKRGSRKGTPRSRVVTWIAVAGVAALGLYGVSQMSNVKFTDEDIQVVNFSELNAKQKRTALEAANRARCTCGCGLGLAECVATDSTCPIRASNIDRIKGMVKEAMAAQPST